MFIKNNNFYIIIFIVIFILCIVNLSKEEFETITCLPGQVEGSDGKCKCPLVGQIYNDNKCKCDSNKKETVINNKTICI